MNALLISERKSLLALYVLYFLVFGFIDSTAQAWAPVSEVERMLLKQRGYPTDTVEQILEATKAESYFVRYAAIHLLTERIGEGAIPVLKQALSDPEEICVRWRAAHLLGILGDKSGLKQMRVDFEKLKAELALPFPDDPNMTPDDRERTENRRNIALHDALDVAKVLVELGDRRGYELAAKAAFEGMWELHKAKAIYVLAEIAKADKKILQAEGIDPVSTLCTIAETEKSPYVFGKIIYSARKLDYDTAVHILEKAKDSPNQSQEKRQEARQILNWLKAKKRAAEIKLKNCK